MSRGGAARLRVLSCRILIGDQLFDAHFFFVVKTTECVKGTLLIVKYDALGLTVDRKC